MAETQQPQSELDKRFIKEAFKEAKKGYEEGGIPIGAVLVSNNPPFKILGRGHNLRIQSSSATLHAEISALENGGRLPAHVYKNATMFTTLSPCDMCTGACLLYGIPRVVMGENDNFVGGEATLRARGIEIINVNDEECKELMGRFIKERPEDWWEDIGEEDKQ